MSFIIMSFCVVCTISKLEQSIIILNLLMHYVWFSIYLSNSCFQDELLTSLLESTGDEPLNLDFDFNPLLPISPGESDLSNSPSYNNNTAHSPASLTSASDNSPTIGQPFSSLLGMSEPSLMDPVGDPPLPPRDVSIDVGELAPCTSLLVLNSEQTP